MKKNILGLGKIQSVFINPYVACNNNCSYCAIGDTEKLPYKIDYHILKIRTNKLIEFIDSIKDELEDNCQFFFLGGEPLITWNSWLIPTIKKLHNINPNFTYRLSTNGTLLTSDKYEDIKNYKIDINLSLDGPKFVHNLNRKLWSGGGSFDLAYDNFLKVPLELSNQLFVGSTIHLNTVQYLPEIFQFMIDLYEIRPFNWFTTTQTDGYDWDEEHLKLFSEGMKKIKELMPLAKFNANFIPNPPHNQNLIINFMSGLITVKSNELANPVDSIIGNLTKGDGFIFEDKLKEYQIYHKNKEQKRVLPNQELCNICPGKDIYCIRKEKEFFRESAYTDLKNFCNHNYILYSIFGGNYYDPRGLSEDYSDKTHQTF